MAVCTELALLRRTCNLHPYKRAPLNVQHTGAPSQPLVSDIAYGLDMASCTLLCRYLLRLLAGEYGAWENGAHISVYDLIAQEQGNGNGHSQDAHPLDYSKVTLSS